MAGYKVLQDIEAEDKFVGPLTLKQFILACIFFVCGYMSFFFLTRHVWFLAIPLIPVMLVSGFLAFPWGRDQPTEIWLLAKIRFILKPRHRIWDQTGMQELVTITAPKHAADQYVSNNLSQVEVKSRLKALADTIDSRGWAVKNASVNMFNQPSAMANRTTDRLIDLSALAREVPNVEVHAADDIMDEQNNPTAVHLSQMVADSSKNHRQSALKTLDNARTPKHLKKADHQNRPPTPDFWFMHQPKPEKVPPDYATFTGTQTVAPGTNDSDLPDAPLTSTEQTLLNQLHKQSEKPLVAYGHTRVIEPLNSKRRNKSASKSKHHVKQTGNREANTSGKTLNPAILEFANNDDLSVATIARQVNKKPEPEPPDNEVVVPLR